MPTLRNRQQCDFCEKNVPRFFINKITNSVIYCGEPSDIFYYFCDDTCAQHYIRHFVQKVAKDKWGQGVQRITKYLDVKGVQM